MMPRLTASRLVACAALSVALGACARPRVEVAPTPVLEGARASGPREAPTPFCLGCTPAPEADEVVHALAVRVADLKARGGTCQAYASVLEGSLAARRIVVRPFMWRVGGNLASAQALSSGEIDVARNVDPLNIGVWSLDDVVHSMEHEAAHIALAIPSGAEKTEQLVNQRVAECRSVSMR